MNQVAFDRATDEAPAVVRAFVDAVNAGRLAELLKTFAPDALVNDQLRDRRGLAAILAWAEEDVIGQNLRLDVVQVRTQHNLSAVRAHVDGDFDMRGLPDPLSVTFHFSTWGERIVQLIILRDQIGRWTETSPT